jgi:hypothetical protein
MRGVHWHRCRGRCLSCRVRVAQYVSSKPRAETPVAGAETDIFWLSILTRSSERAQNMSMSAVLHSQACRLPFWSFTQGSLVRSVTAQYSTQSGCPGGDIWCLTTGAAGQKLSQYGRSCETVAKNMSYNDSFSQIVIFGGFEAAKVRAEINKSICFIYFPDSSSPRIGAGQSSLMPDTADRTELQALKFLFL